MQAFLGGQGKPVDVHSGRRARGVTAEHDPGRGNSVAGQVDPEDVRVGVVVRVQDETPVKGRYGGHGANVQPPAPDEDLHSRTEHGPRLQVGPLGPRAVPAAQVTPDLGVRRNVPPDHRCRSADQLA